MQKTIKERILSCFCGSRFGLFFEFLNHDKLRILYYHRIAKTGSIRDLDDPGMFVEEEQFDLQMRLLKERYHPVSEIEIIDAFDGKKRLPSNAIWVTFDDGYKDNFTFARPILKKYGVFATFFVTTGFINGQHVPRDLQSQGLLEAGINRSSLEKVRDLFMSWDEIGILNRDGFYIGAHTVSHPETCKLDFNAIKEEILLSKEEIEKRLGIKVFSFAYPFGKSSQINKIDGERVLRELGISLAVTTMGGTNHAVRAQRLALCRFGLTSKDDLERFIFKVASAGVWQR